VDDYESCNPHVLGFVQKYAGLTSQQIRADPKWQAATAKKPKHFDQISDADRDAFKKLLDAKFPPLPAIMAKAMAARD
jgi:hypothetical protein